MGKMVRKIQILRNDRYFNSARTMENFLKIIDNNDKSQVFEFFLFLLLKIFIYGLYIRKRVNGYFIGRLIIVV